MLLVCCVGQLIDLSFDVILASIVLVVVCGVQAEVDGCGSAMLGHLGVVVKIVWRFLEQSKLEL